MNVYFLCWLPYQLTVIWYYVDPSSYKEHMSIINLLHLLMVLNSVVNPWIYGLYASEIQPYVRSHMCSFGVMWHTCQFACGCDDSLASRLGSSGANHVALAERFV